MSNYRLSKSSLRNLDGVHPELVDVVKLAIQITKVDFGIPSTGGYRTAETQHKLFLDGKSKADGYDNKSYHQTGNAVDVYAYVDGKASWQPEHLSQVACAMLEAAIRLDVNLRWVAYGSRLLICRILRGLSDERMERYKRARPRLCI